MFRLVKQAVVGVAPAIRKQFLHFNNCLCGVSGVYCKVAHTLNYTCDVSRISAPSEHVLPVLTRAQLSAEQ